MITRCLLLVACSIALGCSSGSQSPVGPGGASREEELNEVAALLRSYDGKGKGPSKPQDLLRYEQVGPLGYAAIKSGEIVVEWGVQMGGEGDAGTDEVIAYEKKVPAEGGLVLLLNGKVKTMSAAEFAAAPKAKK